MTKSTTKELAIINCLSQARFSSYQKHTSNLQSAMKLYVWNMKISSDFWLSLHILEITLRNAVNQALVEFYGEKWCFDKKLLNILKTTHKNKVKEITSQLKKENKDLTVNNFIAQTTLGFWQRFFTKGFSSLWREQLSKNFSYLKITDLKQVIQKLHTEIKQVRILRNRIAHHEPIFNRDLVDDYQTIFNLINYRCNITAKFMQNLQSTENLLSNPLRSCKN